MPFNPAAPVRTTELLEGNLLRARLAYRHPAARIDAEGGQWEVRLRYESLFRLAAELVQSDTGAVCGRFRKLGEFAIWRPNESELLLDDGLFTLYRRRPSVAFSLFRRSTWGYFRFEFSFGDRIADYDLRFKRNGFEGTVRCSGMSPLLAACGLYLVEHSLATNAAS